MNKFRVKVNYTKFNFKDSEEAVNFAVTALNHATEDVTVEIEILNKEDEEDE
jgi:hypothetical protein